MSFKTIALIGKLPVPAVQQTMTELASRLAARGLRVLLEADAEAFGITADGYLQPAELAEAADLMVAVGGDGTMLRAAHAAGPAGTKLVGVNLGHLGFLTDIGAAELEQLDRILDGESVEDARCMIEASVIRDGEEIARTTGLNDLVVQRWDVGRMIEFETWVGGRLVSAHRADGLVIATPTGSTAYALSAGGPILHPGLSTLVLVPICPHTLSDRPLVVSTGETVEVRIAGRTDNPAQVLCDARSVAELQSGDRIQVTLAEKPLRLLHPEGYDYFALLRSKMHWAKGTPGTSR
jgi:NAD+ kinase